ncbi:hypothetical protein Kfla_0811 [Kribbella flavida DSM 17836]|uniref:Uncharacterized protein n=1 Tax=Kribbella flavida (strain DSM 17836 / JCM 10339 / NBRC 14399) TaxID=479435 RepID=D2PYT3_KRIFD|nr:hypothetical protein Kfla_0811 [Kribbella flavida DSM 17836]
MMSPVDRVDPAVHVGLAVLDCAGLDTASGLTLGVDLGMSELTRPTCMCKPRRSQTGENSSAVVSLISTDPTCSSNSPRSDRPRADRMMPVSRSRVIAVDLPPSVLSVSPVVGRSRYGPVGTDADSLRASYQARKASRLARARASAPVSRGTRVGSSSWRTILTWPSVSVNADSRAVSNQISRSAASRTHTLLAPTRSRSLRGACINSPTPATSAINVLRGSTVSGEGTVEPMLQSKVLIHYPIHSLTPAE